jgi:hypothetical protein
MATAGLPADFRDLEAYLEWALERRAERFHKRVGSTMAEITAFYNAMVPRLDETVAYLNSKPLASLEPADKRLLAMAQSLVEISRCVELWQAPDNYAFDADRINIRM